VAEHQVAYCTKGRDDRAGFCRFARAHDRKHSPIAHEFGLLVLSPHYEILPRRRVEACTTAPQRRKG